MRARRRAIAPAGDRVAGVMRGRGLATIALAGLVVAACDGATASLPSAPGASAEPPSIELTLMARGIAYQPEVLSIRTGTKLVIAFDNADPGVPHGLLLSADPAGTIKLAEAPVIVGPDHERFEIAPLVAGRYRLSCVVHPTMVAALLVTPD